MAESELRKIAVILLVGFFSCCVTQEYTQYKDEEAEFIEAEMVILDSVKYNNGTVEVCMRNSGSRLVVIDIEYKNGVIVATEIGLTLEVNEEKCFTLQGTDYSVGDECCLATKGGTTMKFEVRR
jgi:hypothetical protein